MQFRLRTLLILLAVMPPFVAGLICLPRTCWVGHYSLSTCFINDSGKVIDRIEAGAKSTREEADLFVADPDGPERPHFESVNLDKNSMGKIFVRSSGAISTFTGIELSYWKQEALVIFTDGSRSLFAVNTPVRGVRHLDVSIPAPQ